MFCNRNGHAPDPRCLFLFIGHNHDKDIREQVSPSFVTGGKPCPAQVLPNSVVKTVEVKVVLSTTDQSR